MAFHGQVVEQLSAWFGAGRFAPNLESGCMVTLPLDCRFAPHGAPRNDSMGWFVPLPANQLIYMIAALGNANAAKDILSGYISRTKDLQRSYNVMH
jgi:hypothetical protein